MIAIDSALLRLQEQAALSTIDCSLTSIGSMLARLPVDVSIGKMLIFACIFQVNHHKRNVINSGCTFFIFSMSIRP
jgi:HrpA-like RNA helicase